MSRYVEINYPRPQLTDVYLPAIPSHLHWAQNGGRVSAPLKDFTQAELADIALAWSAKFLRRAIEQEEED
jgi:hypothetical protein